DLQQIDPGEIANIEIDTRVLLTRYRGEQILESSIRAVEITERFYMLHPDVQVRTAELFQDMLKALQVKNARDVIQPLMLPPVGAPGSMPDATKTAAAATPKPRKAEPNL